MRLRSLVALLALTLANTVQAGAISELLITDAIQSLDVAERTARGGIVVSLWVILFYIFYLGTIWAFNVAMLITEPSLPDGRRKYAKYFCRANIFLATGDTAMFIAFLIAYLFPDAFATPEGARKLLQLLLLGVVTTSLTMSVYYLYIGMYYRERFARGVWDLLLFFILTFFVIRFVLHYNPDNIWFSMMLPPGQPNHSAWLRNVPLFIYGITAVGCVAFLAWKNTKAPLPTDQRRVDFCVIGAMVALLVSFLLYAIDVFCAHKIPRDWIWIIYTLKTLAYMAAFLLMWLGEFHFGKRVPVSSLDDSQRAVRPV